jgi:hypothetical protein
MKFEKIWGLFLACLLLAVLPACSEGDDDDTADDDDDDSSDDDSSGDDDDSDLDWFPVAYELVWTGDILLADRALDTLEEEGYLHPFEHLWDLTSADYLIGNLEGPITTIDTPYNPNQTWSYNVLPTAAGALADFGFDAMSLANNHLMDRGPDGVADTWDHLLASGIDPFGAGTDAEEASTPLFVSTPLGLIAVVGMSESTSYVPQAGGQSTGSHTFSLARIQQSWNKAMDAGADYVIAFVHWGNNYDVVESTQRNWAQAFADTGFDLVVGHGAHVPQEVDILGDMVVLYSLGNFTFGTPGRFDSEYPGYGLVARTALGLDGFEYIELHCIVTDNDRVHYQPEPCALDEAEAVLSGLGDLVEIEDGVGRVVP